MCQDPPCVLLPAQLPLWDADCLHALWKVGRADKVLLWNKRSRVQGLQLEKASGEAALREVFLWFQWEGVFVWSGETWAQSRGGGKAWAQSCPCFSENKNQESLKACVRPRLSQGKAGAGKPSLFPQSTNAEHQWDFQSWWGQMQQSQSREGSMAGLGCSSWRRMMKTKENVPVFHFRPDFLYPWLHWLWLGPDLK